MSKALEERTEKEIENIRRIIKWYNGKGILIKSSKTGTYHFGVVHFTDSADRMGFFNTLIPPNNKIEAYRYEEIEEIYPVPKSRKLFPKPS